MIFLNKNINAQQDFRDFRHRGIRIFSKTEVYGYFSGKNIFTKKKSSKT